MFKVVGIAVQVEWVKGGRTVDLGWVDYPAGDGIDFQVFDDTVSPLLPADQQQAAAHAPAQQLAAMSQGEQPGAHPAASHPGPPPGPPIGQPGAHPSGRNPAQPARQRPR